MSRYSVLIKTMLNDWKTPFKSMIIITSLNNMHTVELHSTTLVLDKYVSLCNVMVYILILLYLTTQTSVCHEIV